MKNSNQLVKKVAEIYSWLDSQTRSFSDAVKGCQACGRCCDFADFDHRLFVTTPELMYLAEKVGAVKPMPGKKCPYNINGKCTVYKNRFAGCRIFYCKADRDFQSELSESALKKCKLLCAEFEIPYRYSDLATALNDFAG